MDDNDRAKRLQDRARALADPHAWRHSSQLIRDVRMLKGKHGLRGQDKRRATLTGARLNKAISDLAGPPDGPPKRKRWVRAYTRPPQLHLVPSGATWKPDDINPPRLKGQLWIVADHPDIAAPIKQENRECDAVARGLLGPTIETERERLAGLNDAHRALLASIVGESAYVPPPTMSHPAADMGSQTAALDMVFDEAGFSVWERRNRHNDLLESIEKLTRKGKRYLPGKAAGPGRRLTQEELIAAIATLRPAKKHEKPYPRGTETGLFEKCRRAGRKQPLDYMARAGLFEDDEMYRQWDKLIEEPNGLEAGDDYEIVMPEGPLTMMEIRPGWSVNSISAAKMGLIRNATQAAA